MSSYVFEVKMFINTIWELAVKYDHEGRKNPSGLSALQSSSVSQLGDFKGGGGEGALCRGHFKDSGAGRRQCRPRG